MNSVNQSLVQHSKSRIYKELEQLQTELEVVKRMIKIAEPTMKFDNNNVISPKKITETQSSSSDHNVKRDGAPKPKPQPKKTYGVLAKPESLSKYGNFEDDEIVEAVDTKGNKDGRDLDKIAASLGY
jgi:hypothetical protein